MSKKISWGISLGHELKAVALKGRGQIVDLVSVQERDPVSAIEHLSRTFNLKGCKIAVDIRDRDTLARCLAIPPLSDCFQLRKIIQWEAQQNIPFDMNSVAWDNVVFRDAVGNIHGWLPSDVTYNTIASDYLGAVRLVANPSDGEVQSAAMIPEKK